MRPTVGLIFFLKKQKQSARLLFPAMVSWQVQRAYLRRDWTRGRILHRALLHSLCMKTFYYQINNLSFFVCGGGDAVKIMS